MNARGRSKEYPLRHAEVHSFIAENLVIGAFIGEIVLGPITHGSQGESLLQKERTLVFRQGHFPNLAKSLRRAQHLFETKAEEENFQMDVIDPSTRQNLYKITASFGKMDDSSEPTLNLR